MGIRGLQRYILKRKSIAQYCDYKEEIAKWRLEHQGCNPTILIELRETANMIVRIFLDTMITGGIFDKYNEAIAYFFRELKKCNVDLVFFLDVNMDDDFELESWKAFRIAHDALLPGEISRNNFCWIMNVIMIAEKYGKLIISDEDKYSMLAKYALDHEEKVLAVIGNNTELLLYAIKYQYWSVVDWFRPECLSYSTRYPDLNGLRFDRDALLTESGLNNEQLHLLAVMSDTFKRWSHFPECPPNPTIVERLEYAINYVRNQTLTDWKSMARDLYGENYTPEQVAFLEKRYAKFAVRKTSEIVNESELVVDGSNNMLKFCKERHFAIYNTFLACSKTFYFLKDLCRLRIEFHQNVELADNAYSVVVKIAGIFYKDRIGDHRPSILRIHNPLLCENGGDIEERDIIYPPDSHVTLKELIMEPDNKLYDNERWQLFGWVLSLNNGFLATVREIPGTTEMRLVTISINFMLERNLISIKSAKCILRNELFARSSNAYIPKNHCPPPTIHVRPPDGIKPEWVEEAHRYSIVFWLVCQALGACGLQSEMNLIEFNAFNFFEEMNLPNLSGRTSQIEDILFPTNVE